MIREAVTDEDFALCARIKNVVQAAATSTAAWTGTTRSRSGS